MKSRSIFYRLAREAVARYEATTPGTELAETFNKITTPLFDRIVAIVHENRMLAVFRNTLLPKPMSGGIRRRDADKAVEAVV